MHAYLHGSVLKAREGKREGRAKIKNKMNKGNVIDAQLKKIICSSKFPFNLPPHK